MYEEKIEKLLNTLKEKNMMDLTSSIEDACAIIFEYPAVVAFSEARECTAKVKFNKDSKEYETALKEIRNQPEEALKAVINVMNYIDDICIKLEIEKCFRKKYKKLSIELEADRFAVEKMSNEMLKEFKNRADERKIDEIYSQRTGPIDSFEKGK